MQSATAQYSCHLFVGSGRHCFNSQGVLDDLRSSELGDRLNSLKGHDLTQFKEALGCINTAFVSVFCECAQGLCDKSSTDELQVIDKNIRILGDIYEPIMPLTVQKSLVEKSSGIVKTYEKFKMARSKANANAFNKAVLGFKDYKLPVPAQVPSAVDMLRALMVGLTPAFKDHMAFQTEVLRDATTDLQGTVTEIGLIACGTRDGSSWKASITPEMSLKDILNMAGLPKGLLSGPGPKVMMAQKSLEEARLP
jgi:hypothetical protein